jgi:hypothetical protein
MFYRAHFTAALFVGLTLLPAAPAAAIDGEVLITNQKAFGPRVTFQQIQKYDNGTNRVVASRLAALARVLEVRRLLLR